MIRFGIEGILVLGRGYRFLCNRRFSYVFLHFPGFDHFFTVPFEAVWQFAVCYFAARQGTRLLIRFRIWSVGFDVVRANIQDPLHAYIVFNWV